MTSMIRLARARGAALARGGRLYWRALRLMWAAAPRPCAALAALLALQGLLPPLAIWLLKRIIDAAGHGAWGGLGAGLLAAWAAAALAGQLIAQWVMLVQASLNERFTAHVEQQLIRKANSLPDLGAFEDPAFYDDLQTLTRQAPHRPLNLMATTVILAPALLTSAGLLSLLGGIAPWLPPLLIATTLPLGAANLRLQRESWNTTVAQGPHTKAMRYFAGLATTDMHAKEVRVLGAGPFIERRYRQAFEALHRDSSQRRRRQAPRPLAAALLFAGATIFAFWWVVRGALRGQAGPGDIVLVLQSLAALQQSLGGLAGYAALLGGHLLFFEKLFAFLAYQSPMPLAAPGVPAAPLRSGVSFERVSYAYANGRQALTDLSFEIRAGECLALVGENGAGKSTLVKLLCRLYDPTAGAIRVDGTDLRQLDLDDWRRGLGAVFQDFGRYQLTVAENITLGLAEGKIGEERLLRAARQAGFHGHAETLPGGYDAQLGTQFGGVDLSGGQWQTLGIARALLRDAQLLILDEPTAALDPRAEFELFERFRELARGKTTLLITHRLASVRLADRILVLKAGRLAEQGSHGELLRRGGEYAELYRLQAGSEPAA